MSDPIRTSAPEASSPSRRLLAAALIGLAALAALPVIARRVPRRRRGRAGQGRGRRRPAALPPGRVRPRERQRHPERAVPGRALRGPRRVLQGHVRHPRPRGPEGEGSRDRRDLRGDRRAGAGERGPGPEGQLQRRRAADERGPQGPRPHAGRLEAAPAHRRALRPPDREADPEGPDRLRRDPPPHVRGEVRHRRRPAQGPPHHEERHGRLLPGLHAPAVRAGQGEDRGGIGGQGAGSALEAERRPVVRDRHDGLLRRPAPDAGRRR